MKTTNPCLKFNSFLLLSSKPDLVALGKENGYAFTREELECKDMTKSQASYAKHGSKTGEELNVSGK